MPDATHLRIRFLCYDIPCMVACTSHSSNSVYVIACHVLTQTLSCRQVYIGTVLTVDIGILRYSGAANIVFGATVSAIFVATVVIALSFLAVSNAK